MRVLFSQRLIVLSKPRCGSTSVRRMLDGIMDASQGDFAVDTADQRPPYHPHVSAPYLKQLLRADGHDVTGMSTIIVTRHPVEMLWSYYKFFRPDARSIYNYSPRYDPATRIGFQDWLLTGRVGILEGMKSLMPPWVTERDLSPLSLEAHADASDGKRQIDHVFRIEAAQDLADWLHARTGRRIDIGHVNASEPGQVPPISAEALQRVRTMFPEESRLYRV